MVWVGIFVLFLIVALGLLLLKSGLRTQHTGFKMLQESFEGLQRNLLVTQKEFEKFQEMRAHTLRSELSETLQNNRKELSFGLQQTQQALEQKVSAIDLRLDNRLKGLSEGVQNKLELNLKEGFRHFEKVQEHLKQTERQLVNLNYVGQSINDLNHLL